MNEITQGIILRVQGASRHPRGILNSLLKGLLWLVPMALFGFGIMTCSIALIKHLNTAAFEF